MHPVGGAEAFDGKDGFSFHRPHRQFARSFCAAVDQHRAGPALAAAASESCPLEFQVVAQDVEQGSGVPIDGDLMLKSIDQKLELVAHAARPRRDVRYKAPQENGSSSQTGVITTYSCSRKNEIEPPSMNSSPSRISSLNCGVFSASLRAAGLSHHSWATPSQRGSAYV